MMDRKAFQHMRSLARIILDTDSRKSEIKEAEELRKQFLLSFEKMRDALQNGEPTRMRRYFALFSLEDWWYLVYRTYERRGAFLFLRLYQKHGLDKLTKGSTLWKELKKSENWKNAEEDSKRDPAEPVQCTDSDTNLIENEDTPGTSDDGW
ncbi:MAG: hypothetical protein ACFFCT_08445 [Candidatus Odinarchaeota archaeon]